MVRGASPKETSQADDVHDHARSRPRLVSRDEQPNPQGYGCNERAEVKDSSPLRNRPIKAAHPGRAVDSPRCSEAEISLFCVRPAGRRRLRSCEFSQFGRLSARALNARVGPAASRPISRRRSSTTNVLAGAAGEPILVSRQRTVSAVETDKRRPIARTSCEINSSDESRSF